MKKIFVYTALAVAFGALVWFLVIISTYNQTKSETSTSTRETSTTTEVWACNADAKLCPDGSSVGRTGPKCEFEACPTPDATFARIETYLGGRDGGLNLTINPKEVVSDSRCPKDVQCIWAGTVEVKAGIETRTGHGELVFKIGEPRTVGNLTVTLTEVRPSSKTELTPENSYWFVFEATRN